VTTANRRWCFIVFFAGMIALAQTFAPALVFIFGAAWLARELWFAVTT